MDFMNGGGVGRHPSLADIQRDLKSARDMALLGNYVDSEKNYVGIIDIVAGILKAPIADERSKRKWEQVLKQIRDEVEPVRAIKLEWESMGAFGAGMAVGPDAAADEPDRCNLLDDFYTASMAKESPAQRALHRPDDEIGRGQAPVWDGVFAPPSPRGREGGDGGPRQPRQRAESERAEMPGWARGVEPPAVRPKARAQTRPDRDVGGPSYRDVGAAPARGSGSGPSGGGPAARQRNSGVGVAGNDNANAPGGRNYARPWRDNAPSKDDKDSKGGKNAGGAGKDGKKEGHAEAGSYLEHTYGSSGKGPDTDLIEMLERDCVEGKASVAWDAIAGLEDAKKLLEEAVVLPLMMPGYFTGIRRAWKGVLMFGPPGTGKTMLAKAVATQCETVFFNVSAASMASKFRGDAEKLVRILFEMARFYAPTTIFFDEVDALGGKRGGDEHEASRRVKAELLVQMDGVGSSSDEDGATKQVTVLAATNRPWDLDEALRRRLEKRVYIPLPKQEGRKQLFDINLKTVKMGDDVNIDELVKKSDGYSGADVTSVCREAAMMGLRRKVAQLRADGVKLTEVAGQLEKEVNVPVTQVDFLEALKNTSRSVGTEDLQKFSDWMKEFGCS